MSQCKLIIVDEVNIKFEGLTVETRRKIVNKLKFEVPYARHTPAYKLGRWDGMKTYFGIGGNGYLAHLDIILPIVSNDGYQVEIVDNRQTNSIEFTQIDQDFWDQQGKTWPAGHPDAGFPIVLRDYQYDVVNKFLENPQSIQQVATGAGKCRSYDSLLRVLCNNLQFGTTLTSANCTDALTLDVKIGDFCTSVEKYKNLKLVDNIEVDIAELECFVPTPSGLALVHHVIKKENLNGIKITLANGSTIDCANGHILLQSGKDIYASNLHVNDVIDTISGPVAIIAIEPSEHSTFYDISIPAPHLYYDPAGVLHHNTITTATLSKLCEPYGRSIIIVPNKSLVVQTEEDYLNLGLDVGVYFGERKDLNKTHTICTWQSLNVLDKKSKDYDDDAIALAQLCEDVSAVIIDECHQATASVLTNLLTRNFKNCPIRWGLTGTVPKEPHDFLGLVASLGPVVNNVSAKDLQDKGVLANLKINVMQTMDVEVFKTFQDEYSFLVTNDNRINWIASTIKSLASTGNTLVLINRVETGKKLEKLIPDSVFVSGNMKLDDRKAEYDEVKHANEKVIIATYGVAAVGINIPRIFNLVLIEPGKSFVRVIQSIGRGIRKAQDKDFVNIVDITSSCKYSKRHLTERKRFYKEAKYEFSVSKVNTYNQPSLDL